LALLFSSAALAGEPTIVKLWPAKPPGDEELKLPPEANQTKPEDKLIAGRRIIKLGNVSEPTLAVFRPAKEKDTGAAVVICPGGGHRILAYDLEGTEVADWLNTLGVTGIVLKYRVPARSKEKLYLAAVQDAQRAMSLARGRASELGIDAKRIGILGFSAGGETAALATLFTDRQYQSVDETDKVPSRPDFAVLVYPAYLVDQKDTTKLRDHVRVTKDAPPTFLVHAFDDGVVAENSVQLFLALKKAGVPSELHVFDRGGHGYGLRPTEMPVTAWPKRCEEWLKANKLLGR
jgi:acetyl esterase/lipase